MARDKPKRVYLRKGFTFLHARTGRVISQTVGFPVYTTDPNYPSQTHKFEETLSVESPFHPKNPNYVAPKPVAGAVNPAGSGGGGNVSEAPTEDAEESGIETPEEEQPKEPAATGGGTRKKKGRRS